MKNTATIKSTHTRTFGWGNKPFTIHKGMKCELATNLPEGSGYWLKNIPKEMKGNEDFKSWKEVYGILIRPEEVA